MTGLLTRLFTRLFVRTVSDEQIASIVDSRLSIIDGGIPYI